MSMIPKIVQWTSFFILSGKKEGGEYLYYTTLDLERVRTDSQEEYSEF
jgi:hypothetical protein